jgi:hypothetical protein
MDDEVFELGRLHCDLARRTRFWLCRFGCLVHKVVTEYYLPLSANPDVYLVHRASIKTGQYPLTQQPIPRRGSTKPRRVSKPSKIRDVNFIVPARVPAAVFGNVSV